MNHSRQHEIHLSQRCDADYAAPLQPRRSARDAARRAPLHGNASAGLLAFLFLPMLLLAGCSSSHSSPATSTTPPTPEVLALSAQSGSSQSAAGGLTFAAPLEATVTTNSIGTPGEIVTFTAPSSGASGTFANGTTTETDLTNNNGVATSSKLTANSTPGTFMVSATVSGVKTPVTFSLTNIATTSYSFYLSGADSASGSFYALAGSVLIDTTTGNVLGGEQDYNDGFGGITSPSKGDQITGGTLAFPAGNPPGQALLTIQTSNQNINSSGTIPGQEIFGVQFVNASHALITQFDGFATSSGSFDLQTLGAPPAIGAGGYAFTLSGGDQFESPVSYGGVFSVSGSNLTGGIVDVNDAGTGVATTNTAFTGSFTTPDAYGRGSITGVRILGNSLKLNYYIVGPETLRIIDVDSGSSASTTGGPAIGSAFGQGQTQGTANSFSNASLGTSVLAIQGNVLQQFAALAQFTPSNTTSATADFKGVGDDNELINGYISPQAMGVSGTYTIASNGYGSLTFKVNQNTFLGFGNIASLGVYMTDPNLNLEDPNNPTGGGGALVIDMDEFTLTSGAFPGGAGVIIPQTDTLTATTDFNGPYVAGWQIYNNGSEFDMISQGSMTPGGSLSLTGLVSDPFFSAGTPDPTSSADTFTGPPLPDPKNPGRYSMISNKDSLTSVIDMVPIVPSFELVIYQASATQLFWLGDGTASNPPPYVFFGALEQQGSLTSLPAARKSATKARLKR